MAWGMISWEVPLDSSGETYNGQPLVYAALAAQKNYNALYLNCVYGSEERTERFGGGSPTAAASSTWARAASASQGRRPRRWTPSPKRSPPTAPTNSSPRPTPRTPSAKR